MKCETCGRAMRSKRTRPEDAPGTIQAFSKTMCGSCGKRRASGHTGPARPVRPRAELIEDAEWLVETGENVEMAAKRLGYSNPDSLLRTLCRAGRQDLCNKFSPLRDVAA